MQIKDNKKLNIEIKGQKMSFPEKEIFDYISLNYPEKCKEIIDKLGISYNTIRKIQRGEPIRLSLSERLSCRISEIKINN